MSAISFTKMQALGNDFVVINGVEQNIQLSTKFIQKLADRHLGVGFDQLLLIEAAENTEADFYYRIFNADGSEVSQCGNGARCIARFVKESGLTHKNKVIFQSHHGLIQCQILTNNDVQVDMGIPSFVPSKIPFVANNIQILYNLELDTLGRYFEVCPLSVGNPHCVLWVKSFEGVDIQKIGKLLSTHHSFPEGSNVEFSKIVDRKTILVRVFERGVGETLACGSAACAAMIASKLQNLVDDSVKIIMPGGELSVQWDGEGSSVWLTGPAEFVYKGSIESFA